MTKGRLQHAIDLYRSQLLAYEKSAERTLEMAHQHTLSLLQPHLDALYEQIAAAGDDIPVSWLYERQRLENIKHLITNQINSFGGVAQATTQHNQIDGASIGSGSAYAQLNALVPTGISYTFGKPSLTAISRIVGSTKVGTPLAELFHGYGQEAATKAGQALVSGLTLGNNPRKVARDVQQALGISRDRALTTARTEMLRAYRGAALETYKANSDVVEQWRWNCDKSTRTCMACLMMDGTLHDLSEEMEEHCNGRCSPIPVTKSWQDILAGSGVDTSNLPDESPLDDMQTGGDWFAEQSDVVQKSMLGTAKYESWQAGDFELSDIVGQNDNPIWGGSIYVKSLKELVQ